MSLTSCLSRVRRSCSGTRALTTVFMILHLHLLFFLSFIAECAWAPVVLVLSIALSRRYERSALASLAHTSPAAAGEEARTDASESQSTLVRSSASPVTRASSGTSNGVHSVAVDLSGTRSRSPGGKSSSRGRAGSRSTLRDEAPACELAGHLSPSRDRPSESGRACSRSTSNSVLALSVSELRRPRVSPRAAEVLQPCGSPPVSLQPAAVAASLNAVHTRGCATGSLPPLWLIWATAVLGSLYFLCSLTLTLLLVQHRPRALWRRLDSHPLARAALASLLGGWSPPSTGGTVLALKLVPSAVLSGLLSLNEWAFLAALLTLNRRRRQRGERVLRSLPQTPKATAAVKWRSCAFVAVLAALTAVVSPALDAAPLLLITHGGVLAARVLSRRRARVWRGATAMVVWVSMLYGGGLLLVCLEAQSSLGQQVFFSASSSSSPSEGGTGLEDSAWAVRWHVSSAVWPRVLGGGLAGHAVVRDAAWRKLLQLLLLLYTVLAAHRVIGSVRPPLQLFVKSRQVHGPVPCVSTDAEAMCVDLVALCAAGTDRPGPSRKSKVSRLRTCVMRGALYILRRYLVWLVCMMYAVLALLILDVASFCMLVVALAYCLFPRRWWFARALPAVYVLLVAAIAVEYVGIHVPVLAQPLCMLHVTPRQQKDIASSRGSINGQPTDSAGIRDAWVRMVICLVELAAASFCVVLAIVCPADAAGESNVVPPGPRAARRISAALTPFLSPGGATCTVSSVFSEKGLSCLRAHAATYAAFCSPASGMVDLAHFTGRDGLLQQTEWSWVAKSHCRTCGDDSPGSGSELDGLAPSARAPSPSCGSPAHGRDAHPSSVSSPMSSSTSATTPGEEDEVSAIWQRFACGGVVTRVRLPCRPLARSPRSPPPVDGDAPTAITPFALRERHCSADSDATSQDARAACEQWAHSWHRLDGLANSLAARHEEPAALRERAGNLIGTPSPERSLTDSIKQPNTAGASGHNEYEADFVSLLAVGSPGDGRMGFVDYLLLLHEIAQYRQVQASPLAAWRLLLLQVMREYVLGMLLLLVMFAVGTAVDSLDVMNALYLVLFLVRVWGTALMPTNALVGGSPRPPAAQFRRWWRFAVALYTVAYLLAVGFFSMCGASDGGPLAPVFHRIAGSSRLHMIGLVSSRSPASLLSYVVLLLLVRVEGFIEHPVRHCCTAQHLFLHLEWKRFCERGCCVFFAWLRQQCCYLALGLLLAVLVVAAPRSILTVGLALCFLPVLLLQRADSAAAKVSRGRLAAAQMVLFLSSSLLLVLYANAVLILSALYQFPSINASVLSALGSLEPCTATAETLPSSESSGGRQPVLTDGQHASVVCALQLGLYPLAYLGSSTVPLSLLPWYVAVALSGLICRGAVKQFRTLKHPLPPPPPGTTSSLEPTAHTAQTEPFVCPRSSTMVRSATALSFGLKDEAIVSPVCLAQSPGTASLSTEPFYTPPADRALTEWSFSPMSNIPRGESAGGGVGSTSKGSHAQAVPTFFSVPLRVYISFIAVRDRSAGVVDADEDESGPQARDWATDLLAVYDEQRGGFVGPVVPLALDTLYVLCAALLLVRHAGGATLLGAVFVWAAQIYAAAAQVNVFGGCFVLLLLLDGVTGPVERTTVLARWGPKGVPTVLLSLVNITMKYVYLFFFTRQVPLSAATLSRIGLGADCERLSSLWPPLLACTAALFYCRTRLTPPSVGPTSAVDDHGASPSARAQSAEVRSRPTCSPRRLSRELDSLSRVPRESLGGWWRRHVRVALAYLTGQFTRETMFEQNLLLCCVAAVLCAHHLLGCLLLLSATVMWVVGRVYASTHRWLALCLECLCSLELVAFYGVELWLQRGTAEQAVATVSSFSSSSPLPSSSSSASSSSSSSSSSQLSAASSARGSRVDADAPANDFFLGVHAYQLALLGVLLCYHRLLRFYVTLVRATLPRHDGCTELHQVLARRQRQQRMLRRPTPRACTHTMKTTSHGCRNRHASVTAAIPPADGPRSVRDSPVQLLPLPTTGYDRIHTPRNAMDVFVAAFCMLSPGVLLSFVAGVLLSSLLGAVQVVLALCVLGFRRWLACRSYVVWRGLAGYITCLLLAQLVARLPYVTSAYTQPSAATALAVVGLTAWSTPLLMLEAVTLWLLIVQQRICEEFFFADYLVSLVSNSRAAAHRHKQMWRFMVEQTAKHQQRAREQEAAVQQRLTRLERERQLDATTTATPRGAASRRARAVHRASGADSPLTSRHELASSSPLLHASYMLLQQQQGQQQQQQERSQTHSCGTVPLASTLDSHGSLIGEDASTAVAAVRHRNRTCAALTSLTPGSRHEEPLDESSSQDWIPSTRLPVALDEAFCSVSEQEQRRPARCASLPGAAFRRSASLASTLRSSSLRSPMWRATATSSVPGRANAPASARRSPQGSLAASSVFCTSKGLGAHPTKLSTSTHSQLHGSTSLATIAFEGGQDNTGTRNHMPSKGLRRKLYTHLRRAVRALIHYLSSRSVEGVYTAGNVEQAGAPDADTWSREPFPDASSTLARQLVTALMQYVRTRSAYVCFFVISLHYALSGTAMDMLLCLVSYVYGLMVLPPAAGSTYWRGVLAYTVLSVMVKTVLHVFLVFDSVRPGTSSSAPQGFAFPHSALRVIDAMFLCTGLQRNANSLAAGAGKRSTTSAAATLSTIDQTLMLRDIIMSFVVFVAVVTHRQLCVDYGVYKSLRFLCVDPQFSLSVGLSERDANGEMDGDVAAASDGSTRTRGAERSHTQRSSSTESASRKTSAWQRSQCTKTASPAQSLVSPAAPQTPRAQPRGLCQRFLQNVLQRRGAGADYYTLQFLADVLSIALLIWAYYALTSSSSSSDNIIYSVKHNLLPGALVVILFALVILLCAERVLYVTSSTRVKLAMHCALAVFYNVAFLTWRVVSPTALTTAPAAAAITLFAVKSVALWVSALQLREGYPLHRRHDAFTTKANLLHWLGFTVFYAVPFLFELRLFLDWSFSRTALKVQQWMLLEDIHYWVYRRYVDIHDLHTTSRKKGRAFPWLVKSYQGIVGFSAILLVIFTPLFLYCTFGSQTASNSVVQWERRIVLGQATVFYEGRAATATSAVAGTGVSSGDESANTLADVWASVPQAAAEGFGTVGSLQQLSFPACSASEWVVTAPALSRLLGELEAALLLVDRADATSVTTVSSFSLLTMDRVERATVSSSASRTIWQTSSYAMPVVSVRLLRNFLLQRRATVWGGAVVNVSLPLPLFYSPLALNSAADVTSQAYAAADCTMQLHSGSHSVRNRTQASLSSSSSSYSLSYSTLHSPPPASPSTADEQIYWCVVCGPPKPSTASQASTAVMASANATGMTILVSSTDVPVLSTSLSFLPSLGIIALYTTFVFAISTFLRNRFSGDAHRIVLMQVANPEPIAELLRYIYLARSASTSTSRSATAAADAAADTTEGGCVASHLLLEQQLFLELVDLLRVPGRLAKTAGLRVNDYDAQGEFRRELYLVTKRPF